MGPQLAVILVLLAGQTEPRPEVQSANEPPASTISVGARAGLEGALILLPMAGVTAGVTTRVRFNDFVSIEPHVDGALDSLILIGFLHGQGGVPVVFSRATSDAEFTQHVGFGPVIGHGILAGHVDNGVPPITMVGGELFVGVDWPIAHSLDARVQGRAWVASPIDQPVALIGMNLTVGLMYGL